MMANASRKQLGPGTQDGGKGDGTGAMADDRADLVPDNMVLSNRDKTQHSASRGQDSKWLQTEQMKDHSANKAGD